MHFTQKRRSRLGCLGPQPGDCREEATISTLYAQPPPPRLPRRGSLGGLGEGLKPDETEIPSGRADCGSHPRRPRVSRLCPRETLVPAANVLLPRQLPQPPLDSPAPSTELSPPRDRTWCRAAPRRAGGPSRQARRGIASVWGPLRRLRSCLARPRTASAQPIPRYSRAQEPRSIPLRLGPASSRSRHSTAELSSRSLTRSHSSPHSPRVARLGV